ncbi:hypothetical protein H2509_06590 [Stappia sp. F7233]|uniref:Uncharacterized protein n=1 Tax=Stappia albiluteola TaxID=2758565 RepID=A0A839ACU1_9HYPH|nr:hypothetical protein [Stappia albiluteola]MBA5776794.1 hypothetical protein [Stappia albiluteola]
MTDARIFTGKIEAFPVEPGEIQIEIRSSSARYAILFNQFSCESGHDADWAADAAAGTSRPRGLPPRRLRDARLKQYFFPHVNLNKVIQAA